MYGINSTCTVRHAAKISLALSGMPPATKEIIDFDLRVRYHTRMWQRAARQVEFRIGWPVWAAVLGVLVMKRIRQGIIVDKDPSPHRTRHRHRHHHHHLGRHLASTTTNHYHHHHHHQIASHHRQHRATTGRSIAVHTFDTTNRQERGQGVKATCWCRVLAVAR